MIHDLMFALYRKTRVHFSILFRSSVVFLIASGKKVDRLDTSMARLMQRAPAHVATRQRCS